MSIMMVMLWLLHRPESENVHDPSRREEAPLYDCGQFGFTFPWTHELRLGKECTYIITVMGNEA